VREGASGTSLCDGEFCGGWIAFVLTRGIVGFGVAGLPNVARAFTHSMPTAQALLCGPPRVRGLSHTSRGCACCARVGRTVGPCQENGFHVLVILEMPW
jgi:hypothetical protein